MEEQMGERMSPRLAPTSADDEEAKVLAQEIREMKEIFALSVLLATKAEQKYAVLAYFAREPRSLLRHPQIALLIKAELLRFMSHRHRREAWHNEEGERLAALIFPKAVQL